MLFDDGKWFPALDSQQVVGRVIEVEKEHPAKSRELGRSVKIWVPYMASKVLKDSADVSGQEIKPHNQVAITSRFPGAWEHYLKLKENQPNKDEVVAEVPGNAIENANFIHRDKILYLKHAGFSTIEQLAAMDDHQMQSLGRGAREWRKKAVQHLQKAS
jgi:hypothetical protein